MKNHPTLKYEEVPDVVLDFAYGLDGMAQIEALVEKYTLGDGGSKKLYEIVDDILQHELPLDQLRKRLKDDFQVEEDVVDALRRDFTGRLLLPMESIFEDIKGRLKKWGGTPKDYKDVPGVELPERSATDFVDEVLINNELKTGVDRLDDRLMDILRSYVVNARTREQTIDMLANPIKTGGLDLSIERAGQLLDKIDEDLPFYKIIQTGTIIQKKRKEDEETENEVPPEGPPSGESGASERSKGEERLGAGDSEEKEESEDEINEDLGAQAAVREPDTEADQVKGSQTLAGDEEGDDNASKSTEDEEGYVDLFANETKVSSDDVASQDASKENEKEASVSKQDASQEDGRVDLFADDEVNEGKQEEAAEAGSDLRTKDEEGAPIQGGDENSGASKRIAPPPIVSKVSTEITEERAEDEDKDADDEEVAAHDDENVGEEVQDKDWDEKKHKQDSRGKEVPGEAKTEPEEREGSGVNDSKTEALEPVKEALQEKADQTAGDPTDVLEKGAVVDVFDEEDEKEIREVEKKTKKISEKIPPAVDLESAVKNVMGRIDITFDEPENEKRFKNSVETRMRDIRDAYETRSRLEATPENGGVGLSGGVLSETMQVIEDVFVEYHESLEGRAKEQAKAATKNRSKQRKEKEDKEKQALEKRKEARYKKIADQVENKRKTADSVSDDTQEDEDLVDLEQIKEAAKNEAENGEKKERPKMQDVRFEQKLSGPVEQLKSMRLVDFRRLSSDPQKAIDKIEDDIDLLESDGYENRVAGIEAWRKSPVNQKYAELSRRSLNEGKGLEAIVKQQPEEEKTLTWKEVQAVMELNERLRF